VKRHPDPPRWFLSPWLWTGAAILAVAPIVAFAAEQPFDLELAMLVAAGPLMLLVGTRLHFGYHRRQRGPGYDVRDYLRELWQSFEEAD
jgi:hypothetical protein